MRISTVVDGAARSFVDKQSLGDFYELVRYHMGWQPPAAGDAEPAGQRQRVRFRACLCILGSEAHGGTLETALPMAVAVALLHNFAVNQEDLELGREVSRGRRSAWSVYGIAQAMNAGDGMHALAKMALLEARGRIPGTTILRLEEELDERCLRICEAIRAELGQAELAGGGSSYALELAARKSAVLFGCAAYSGAYLAGAGEEASRALDKFGELLGSAAGVLPLSRERAAEFHGKALAALSACGLPEDRVGGLRLLADYVVNGRD